MQDAMNEKSLHRVSSIWILGRLWMPVLMVALLLPGLSDAKTGRTGRDGGKVPAALIRWPENNSPYAILVDKAEQRVYIYRTDELTRPVKTFRCSTGENDGPKTRRNDKKTPEGVYFFTDAYEERELTPIYGPRAFPVDYPNPLDLKEGKDGYGIWFHGTNKPLKPKDTNGCIALENGNIDALGAFITLHDTPTIISSRLEMVEPVELERERVALELLIEGWRSAWEEKRIDDYISFYGDAFFQDREDRRAWRDHKAGLAEKYDWIRVDVENLRLLRHDGTVLARFDQHYRSDAFDSRGEKRLYIRKNSSEWKIVGEYFSAETERIRPAGKPEPEPDPAAGIRELVARWERAWEGQDLRAYIDCYDTSFRSRGMDLAAWKRHRQVLNRKQDLVRVDVRDLEIRILDGSRAKASFKQDYRADDYRDFGLKELLLVKRGGTWKIRKEEWRALDRGAR
jgi:murein L,D-transpeptidase YafK